MATVPTDIPPKATGPRLIRVPSTPWLFTLALLVVVTTAGLRFGWPIYREYAAVRQLNRLGAFAVSRPGGPAWLRRQVGDKWMAAFDSLYIVRISDSPAVNECVANLRGLTSVQHLAMDGSKIRDRDLSHLPSTETLYLQDTQITDLGLIHLARLPGLKQVYLDRTQVTDTGMAQIQKLTSLVTVTINETQLTDAGLLHLKGLANLKSLGLAGTEVTDAGLIHLKGFVNLEELVLDHAQVTDAGLEHLKMLPQLKHLSLKGTAITDDGVANLQRSLPALRIVK